MKTDSSRTRNLPVFLIPPPPLGPLPARYPHLQKGIGEYNLTSITVLQWKMAHYLIKLLNIHSTNFLCQQGAIIVPSTKDIT